LYVGDTPASSIDYQLMSATPELAQDNLRMRERIKELIAAMEAKATHSE